MQRLFNSKKPTDELTQWSADFLKDLKVSVDGVYDDTLVLLC